MSQNFLVKYYFFLICVVSQTRMSGLLLRRKMLKILRIHHLISSQTIETENHIKKQNNVVLNFNHIKYIEF